MELKDEIRSRFEKSHRLARRYYDEGKVGKARVEYLNCSQLLEHLAELSPPQKKKDILI